MFNVVVLILGLCLGSFVSALVWRLHEKERIADASERLDLKKVQKKPAKNFSILSGRSMCAHCHHVLAAKDLVPLFSWLFLNGKCRYCGRFISWHYPLVELLSTVLFIISYAFWQYTFSGIYIALFFLWLVILIGYIALALYDFKYMELPNGLVINVSIASLLWVALYALAGNSITPNILGGLTLAGFFYLLWIVSGGKWIGGGDVKLSFALGLLAGGIINVLLLLLFASLLGTLYGLPLLFNKKSKNKQHTIPFGPFLIMSTIVVFLFGKATLELFAIN